MLTRHRIKELDQVLEEISTTNLKQRLVRFVKYFKFQVLSRKVLQLYKRRMSKPENKLPKLKVLEKLVPKDIRNFLYQYKQNKEIDATIKLTVFISGEVAAALERRGVKMDDEDKLVEYLQGIMDREELHRKEQTLRVLNQQLHWPDDASDANDAIAKFMDSIYDIIGGLDIKEDRFKFGVVKILIKKIPKEFLLQESDFEQKPELVELENLRDELIKRKFVIEAKYAGESQKDILLDVNKTTTVEDEKKDSGLTKELIEVFKSMIEVKQAVIGTPPPARTYDRANIICHWCKKPGHIQRDCNMKRKFLEEQNMGNPPEKKSTTEMTNRPSNGNPDAQKPFVLQVNNTQMDDSIEIELFDATAQDYVKVKGCLDSGSSRTVGSIDLHGKICGNLLEPRYVVQVQLPDGKKYNVEKVGYLTIRFKTSSGMYMMGRTLVYLVNVPNWAGLLIGKTDLKRLGLDPNQLLEDKIKESK